MGREAKRRGERERKRKEKKRGQTGPNISIFFSLIRCKRWHITEAIIINHLFCLFLLCFLQYCEANDMQICFVFLTPTGDDPLRKRNGRGAEGGGNNSEEKKKPEKKEKFNSKGKLFTNGAQSFGQRRKINTKHKSIGEETNRLEVDWQSAPFSFSPQEKRRKVKQIIHIFFCWFCFVTLLNC